jgi:hypothetical protein
MMFPRNRNDNVMLRTALMTVGLAAIATADLVRTVGRRADDQRAWNADP